MVTVVVIINLLISLLLLYLARRVWLWRLRLARIADTLIAAERTTHGVLYNAPEAIYVKQQKIRLLRQTFLALELQFQRVRYLIGILILTQQAWSRIGRQIRYKSRK